MFVVVVVVVVVVGGGRGGGGGGGGLYDVTAAAQTITLNGRIITE